MKAAWEWMKRHWELLLGALLVVLGFLFGISLRRRPVIVPGKSSEQLDAEETAQQDIADIRKKAEEDKEELKKEHSDSLAAVVEDQEQAAPELVKNTDATNQYLKQVGDLVRGGDGGRKQ